MVDLAVVVCEPTPARALTVAPILKQLADDGVPHMLFINKIDTLEGSVSDTLAALQGFAGSPLVLRPFPRPAPPTGRSAAVRRSGPGSSAKMSSISSRRRRALSRRTLGRSR